MKEIKAIIQPGRLYAAITALRGLPDTPGFTLSEIRGFSRGHADPHSRSHGIDAIDSFELMKIECVVLDEHAEAVIEAIRGAAHTGASGDGKIFIYEVADAVAVRTGARGEQAL